MELINCGFQQHFRKQQQYLRYFERFFVLLALEKKKIEIQNFQKIPKKDDYYEYKMAKAHEMLQLENEYVDNKTK